MKSSSPGATSRASPGAASPGPASPSPAPPAGRTESPTPTGEESAPQPTGALTGTHWLQQGLPQLEEPEETDSTLGSDVESSTASITSSILNYRTISGRTYHSDSVTDGEYWGPNDTKHVEALDPNYHAVDLMLGGKLHLAPLDEKKLANAIDIGTGSGLWAIDFADKYPTCSVVGTDISPIQPNWVPPNLHFDINDAAKTWAFRDDHFDYVHMQFRNGVFENLTNIYKEAYRCCKPGGWLEHADVTAMVSSDDGTVRPDSAMAQWGKLFDMAGKKIGRSMTTADNSIMEAAMRDAGFVNIKVENYKMPLSPWSDDPILNEVSLYCYATLTSDIEGMTQFLFGNVLGWSEEEMAIYTAHVRSELKDTSNHEYVKWQVVYGQKPE